MTPAKGPQRSTDSLQFSLFDKITLRAEGRFTVAGIMIVVVLALLSQQGAIRSWFAGDATMTLDDRSSEQRLGTRAAADNTGAAR